MAKVIAGRYKLDSEQTNTNFQVPGCEIWLAEDKQTGQVLFIHHMPRAKANELTHHLLLVRAAELHEALPPIFYILDDFDFDTQNSCYYFVYRFSERGAKRLPVYLKQSPKIPRDKAIAWLLEIAMGIRELHRLRIAHGGLQPETVLIPNMPDENEPPIRIENVGLVGLVHLLGGQGDTIDAQSLLERDRLGFIEIAKVLLNSQETGEAILSAISESRPEYAGFQEFVPICVALQKEQRMLEQETRYYMTPTKKALEVLVENGFIAEPNLGYARDFLQQELDRGALMSVESNRRTGKPTYSIITPQLELVCAPEDRDKGKARCLVVITVHIHEPAALAELRESAQPITIQLQMMEGTYKCPAQADITPLLETMEGHSRYTKLAESAKFERKFYMRDWTMLLDEMKQRLERFRLGYSNWELVDNDTALLVHLNKKKDAPDDDFDQDDFATLAEETIFCLSSNEKDSRKPKPISVGYLEERQTDSFKIGLLPGVDVDSLSKQGVITIDNRQEKAILKRQQDAIARLRLQKSANPHLASLVLDAATLRIDNAPEPDLWFQTMLDANQKKAVRHALATQDLYLIQGPPGTGKTAVIAEIVLQIYQQDPQASVLISSQSNVAVNNALEKIVEVHPGLRNKVVRIGKREKAGSALSLLFEEQIRIWVEQTRQRSQGFLSKEEQELSKSGKGMDLLTKLDTLEQIRRVYQSKVDEQNRLQEQLREIAKQYTDLETLAKEVACIQKKLAALGDGMTSGTGSSRWHAVFHAFQTEYIPQAQQLLAELAMHTDLDREESKVNAALGSLKTQIDELGQEIRAFEKEIDSLLNTNYGKRLKELDDPRRFVISQNAGFEEKHNRLQRLLSLGSKWFEALRDQDALADVFVTDCQIFGATCIGVAGHPVVGNMDFDWVIVDEAGRATPPEILVPMVKGRRVILVGDHKQLPPVINPATQSAAEALQIDVDSLKMSLFQGLFEAAKQARHELNTQYRMHPVIGDLVSKCFYDGKLGNGVEVEEKLHGLSSFKTPVIWLSTQGKEKQEKRSSSYYNQSEADAILHLLTKIDRDHAAIQPASLSVGIIAGYQEQKKHLRSTIANRTWNHLGSVEVDTVDAYQGRERDVIIYSVVRSNPEGKIGFLRDARRLNVALSRARKLLIIVGNDATVSSTQVENPFHGVLNFIRSNPKQCLLERSR